jgi:hypothetical protein
MQSVLLSETQMNYYQITKRYILEDSDFHILIDIYLFINYFRLSGSHMSKGKAMTVTGHEGP